ncbi:MAG: hypothetical protein LW855_06575 [Alphaproteobacteria bacterium]|jgi:hypothetical protein|nr:hypothetical protein [Alphaproteobacteria bacterium]
MCALDENELDANELDAYEAKYLEDMDVEGNNLDYEDLKEDHEYSGDTESELEEFGFYGIGDSSYEK